MNIVDPSGAFCIPHAFLATSLTLGFLSIAAFALIPFGGPALLLTIVGLAAGAGAGIDGYLEALAANAGKKLFVFRRAKTVR